MEFHVGTYTVSQKNCAELFLSGFRQISTNFDNFGQRDGKEAKLIIRQVPVQNCV